MNTSTKTQNLPPLVPGKFLLGNAIEMGKDPLSFIYQSYVKYGSVFRVKALNRKMTILAGPELEKFMKKGDQKVCPAKEYSDFTNALADSEKSILSMTGKEHLQLRGILTPGFSPMIILNNRAEIIEAVCDQVRKKIQEGNPVKVIGLAQRLVSESLAFMLTGERLPDIHDQMAYLFREALKMYMSKTTPTIFRHNPSYKSARKDVLEFMNRLNDQKWEEYQNGAGDETDLMFRLYEGLKKYPDLLKDDEIAMNALIPFTGGLDTVANTTAFLLYYLLNDSSLLDPIKKEAAHIVDVTQELGLRELKAQETLFCLQMEILRLHPIAGLIKRIAETDFEFGGYTIPKGTELILGTSCTHKMEEFFPNPEKLDIDRHKPPRNEYRQRAFAPYGLGAHKCIGNRISEVTIMFIVAALVDNFEMEIVPKDWKLKVRQIPTLCPTDDFEIKFTEKTKNKQSLKLKHDETI